LTIIPIVGRQPFWAQDLIRLWLIVWCFFFIFCARAQEAEISKADEVYQQGLRHLATNDLAQAKLLMEKAVELNPNNAGAWLDLSLIHCQLGDVERANHIWDKIEARFSPPSSLKAVIHKGRSHGCEYRAKKREVELEVARGHSSNMNQGVKSLSLDLPSNIGPVPVELLPQFGRTPDSYTQLNGTLRLTSPGPGVQARLSFQQRENDHLKTLNIMNVGMDASIPQSIDIGLLDWGAGLGQSTLGGSLFQRSTRLRVGLRPHAQPLPGWDLAFGLAASQVDYPNFENMTSSPRDLQVSFFREWAGARLELFGQRSTDYAKEARPGGDKSGSRLGINLLQVLQSLGEHSVFAKLSWDAQSWRGTKAYSPGFIDEPRKQLLSTTSFVLSLPHGKTEIWSFEARQQRNSENIKLFEYEVKTLELSYKRNWGF
jgi:hypothetical protein